MKVIIEGSENNVKKLLKVNSLFMKRNSLESYTENKVIAPMFSDEDIENLGKVSDQFNDASLKIDELTNEVINLKLANETQLDVINESISSVEALKAEILDKDTELDSKSKNADGLYQELDKLQKVIEKQNKTIEKLKSK